MEASGERLAVAKWSRRVWIECGRDEAPQSGKGTWVLRYFITGSKVSLLLSRTRCTKEGRIGYVCIYVYVADIYEYVYLNKYAYSRTHAYTIHLYA